MEYQPVQRSSQEEIESAISRDDPDELSQLVLSAALYSDNLHWSEGICLRLSNHEHFVVRGNAVLGFGHLARIHGRLNQVTVKPAIEAALVDSNDYVRGQAHAAAGDVEFFLNWKVNR